MTEASDISKPKYNATVQLTDASSMILPISAAAPLFVVGPNGAGKSGLIHQLYRTNNQNAVRLSAHRQTWMQSNFVPFSPQDKVSTESSKVSQDQ